MTLNNQPHWEHFAHRADMGMRGVGHTPAEAFEQAALANRQILTHLVRDAFAQIFRRAHLALLYDVSHNICKEEVHQVDGRPRRLSWAAGAAETFVETPGETPI